MSELIDLAESAVSALSASAADKRADEAGSETDRTGSEGTRREAQEEDHGLGLASCPSPCAIQQVTMRRVDHSLRFGALLVYAVRGMVPSAV